MITRPCPIRIVFHSEFMCPLSIRFIYEDRIHMFTPDTKSLKPMCSRPILRRFGKKNRDLDTTHRHKRLWKQIRIVYPRVCGKQRSRSSLLHPANWMGRVCRRASNALRIRACRSHGRRDKSRSQYTLWSLVLHSCWLLIHARCRLVVTSNDAS